MSFVRKPERKRPPGRPRRWRINNIKMEILEIELGGGMAEDRYSWRALLNAVMNFWVP
jgi:hypothetical protein